MTNIKAVSESDVLAVLQSSDEALSTRDVLSRVADVDASEVASSDAEYKHVKDLLDDLLDAQRVDAEKSGRANVYSVADAIADVHSVRYLLGNYPEHVHHIRRKLIDLMRIDTRTLNADASQGNADVPVYDTQQAREDLASILTEHAEEIEAYSADSSQDCLFRGIAVDVDFYIDDDGKRRHVGTGALLDDDAWHAKKLHTRCACCKSTRTLYRKTSLDRFCYRIHSHSTRAIDGNKDLLIFDVDSAQWTLSRAVDRIKEQASDS